MCAPYFCLNPAFAADVQPSNMKIQNAWSDNQECYIKAFPKSEKPKSKEVFHDVQPFSEFTGTPVSYDMQSFHQPFQICKKPIDFGNDKIKERNLWNEMGEYSLNERPMYKPCLPGKVSLTRKGEPVSNDGILETANNLRNVPAESRLIGQDSRRCLVKDDTAVLDKQNRQVCADNVLTKRDCPHDSLVRIYEETKINPVAFKEQLYNEFPPYHNTIAKKPSMFRNSTKSKMTNSCNH